MADPEIEKQILLIAQEMAAKEARKVLNRNGIYKTNTKEFTSLVKEVLKDPHFLEELGQRVASEFGKDFKDCTINFTVDSKVNKEKLIKDIYHTVIDMLGKEYEIILKDGNKTNIVDASNALLFDPEFMKKVQIQIKSKFGIPLEHQECVNLFSDVRRIVNEE